MKSEQPQGTEVLRHVPDDGNREVHKVVGAAEEAEGQGLDGFRGCREAGKTWQGISERMGWLGCQGVFYLSQPLYECQAPFIHPVQPIPTSQDAKEAGAVPPAGQMPQVRSMRGQQR